MEESEADHQCVVGRLLNGACNALAVLTAEENRAKDEEIERSLKERLAVLTVLLGRLSTQENRQEPTRLGKSLSSAWLKQPR